MAELRVGCSGWNYRHWRGPVYPESLATRQWFAYYATLFDTVEVNNTFYRLPEPSTFGAWNGQAPEHFLYALKASRFLTHLKRLRDPEEPVQRFFERACRLGAHLGPVLYQLPGNFHIDLSRHENLLAILPRTLGEAGGPPSRLRLRHVFEFRHPSWYVRDTLDVLRSHGAVMCLHDKLGSAVLEPMDMSFVYVRFHGPGGRYVGRYDIERLKWWAGALIERLRAGRDVFAYFNNDPEGMAVVNARELKTLLRPAAR